MESTATAAAAAPTSRAPSPLQILSEIAPAMVPALYAAGEAAWPRHRQYRRKKWGVVGPEATVHETLPRRFEVLLRKRDLSTLRPCWRLEAGGPVEFFEWDGSGRISGTYGVRYHVISVAPVVDEQGRHVGFAINARTASGGDGIVQAIDARLDSAAFVRATDGAELAAAMKNLGAAPRVEESRPGMEPTTLYFDVLRLNDKTDYFLRRGANEYVGAGWTPESIRAAAENPRLRALIIGNPAEPTQTPEPAPH